MNAYGVAIDSDVDFPLNLPSDSPGRYRLQLSSQVPALFKSAITCEFPFYTTHGRRVYLFSDRIFEGNEAGQPWCCEVKDVIRFYWCSGENAIYYELSQQCSDYLLGFWFIHLVLPLYLSLEGVYDFFHAGCVEVDGVVMMFVAPSMGGKSTLAEFFIKQGHSLVADDKVPTIIEGGCFMAGGSHPYHRPYRKFEELGNYVENFSSAFKPTQGFYGLTSVAADGDIKISEVRGVAKFSALLPHYLYRFSFLEEKRMNYLIAMLNSVRAFDVTVPWDLKKLPEVHNTIYNHSRDLL